MTFVLTLVLAVAVGLSLALLGGGGSILTVPLLVYVPDVSAKDAIATSLVLVGVTSAVGAVGHARRGRIRWRTGLIFGAAGMAGAFGGGILGSRLPGELLLAAFALMMIATAVAMLRGRKEPDPDSRHAQPPVLRVLLDGAVVGLVTGLVGAGGGFLVVLALALLGGLPMPVAVGTSLLVIAIKSFAGFAGYLSVMHIDWTLTAAVTAAAVLGALIGGRLVDRIPATGLRRGFGWFVLATGAAVLAQRAPGGAALARPRHRRCRGRGCRGMRDAHPVPAASHPRVAGTTTHWRGQDATGERRRRRRRDQAAAPR